MEREIPAQPLFPRRALVRLLLPLVVEQLLAMTIGMVDTMMVTTVGEHAVSGVSLVDNISILLINIFSALATGGAVVAAQYIGSRDRDNACSAAKQLVYTVTGLAVGVSLVCLILRAQLLRLIFGALDADIFDAAMTYFLYTALSYPFLALYNAGAALFRAMGNSRVSMLNSLLMNLLNGGINALLIFGAGMGVAGAGWGTLLSRMVGAAVMTFLLCRPGQTIQVERLFRPELNFKMIRRILRVGVPTGMENGMFQIGKLLVLGLVTPLGKAATAANAIAGSIASMVNVPGQAVGLSLITVVGQCMGAGEHKQAARYTRILMTVAYVAMGALGLLLFFFAAPVAGIFNLSPEAVGIAEEVLRCFSLFTVFFWPMSFSLPNALRAAGDAKFTMYVSVLSMWICRVGLSYLFVLGLQMGVLGVWLAMCLDWVVRSACFLTRFLRGRWRSKTVI